MSIYLAPDEESEKNLQPKHDLGWLGADDAQESPQNTLTNLVRKFWLQEKIYDNWVNIQEFSDDKACLMAMAQLVKSVESIQLRMVMTDFSIIDGNNNFQNILLVSAKQNGFLSFNADFSHAKDSRSNSELSPYLMEHIQNVAPEFNLEDSHQSSPAPVKPPLSEIMGDDMLVLSNEQIRDMLQAELAPHLAYISQLVKAELNKHFGDAPDENISETPQSPELPSQETPINPLHTSEVESVPENQNYYKPSYVIAASEKFDIPMPKAVDKLHKGDFYGQKPDEAVQVPLQNPTQNHHEIASQINDAKPQTEETLILDSWDMRQTLRAPGRKTAMKSVQNLSLMAPQMPSDTSNPFSLFNPKEEQFSDNYFQEYHENPLKNMRSMAINDNRAHQSRIQGRHQSRPQKQTNSNQPRRKSKKLASSLVVGFLAVSGALGLMQKDNIQQVVAKMGDSFTTLLPEADLVDAVRRANPVMVRQLLEKGANPNSKDRYGDPVILTAARLSDMASLNLLAQGGAKLTEKDKFGQPLIYTLAQEGRVEPLEAMLKLGAPIDYRVGNSCRTPLQIAAENGRTRVVQLLTEKGAEIGKLPGCEKAPQDYALNTEISDIFQKAAADRLEKTQKANPEMQSAKLTDPTIKTDDAAKPLGAFEQKLVAAIKTNNLKIVQETLKSAPEGVKFADLNIFVSGVSGTAYRNITDYALLQKSFPIAAFFQKKMGISYTPEMLHWAIDEGDKAEYKDLTKFLIRLGGDVNSFQAGLTPLMRAAVRNRTEIVESLLKAGADPQLKSNKGETAANLASLTGNKELLEMLIMAEKEGEYHAVMGNFTWSDNLADVEKNSEVCTDIQDGFRACKLKKTEWLGEKNVVMIALFDKLNANKLVALQVDLGLTNDSEALKKYFDKIIYKITQNIPKNHHNFTDKRETKNIPLFAGLASKTKAHEIYSYWSDEDRQKPVFIHIKMQADKADAGSIRVKIGNPFRAG